MDKDMGTDKDTALVPDMVPGMQQHRRQGLSQSPQRTQDIPNRDAPSSRRDSNSLRVPRRRAHAHGPNWHDLPLRVRVYTYLLVHSCHSHLSQKRGVATSYVDFF